jgi:hypothetical protein
VVLEEIAMIEADTETDTNVMTVIYGSLFDRTLTETDNSGPADLDRLGASLDYMKQYFCSSTPDEADELQADTYALVA